MGLFLLLKGKLTYLMAAVAILWGAVGLWQGWVDQTTAYEIIWGGLTVFGIRRAISGV